MKYQIIRIATAKEGTEKRSSVETFEEKPAPHVTLGGRLLALQSMTSDPHIAELITAENK